MAALERVKRDGNAAAKAKAEEALVEVQDVPPAYGMHSREQRDVQQASDRRERDVENATVNQYDRNSTRHMGKWFIIDNDWCVCVCTTTSVRLLLFALLVSRPLCTRSTNHRVTRWQLYVGNISAEAPGPIPNDRLVDSSGRVRSSDFKLAVNYRALNFDTWTYLQKIHGGGPAIVRPGPLPGEASDNHPDMARLLYAEAIPPFMALLDRAFP